MILSAVVIVVLKREMDTGVLFFLPPPGHGETCYLRQQPRLCLLNSWQIPITRRFHCQGFSIIACPFSATHMDPLNLASSPAIPNRHPNGCHLKARLRHFCPHNSTRRPTGSVDSAKCALRHDTTFCAHRTTHIFARIAIQLGRCEHKNCAEVTIQLEH